MDNSKSKLFSIGSFLLQNSDLSAKFKNNPRTHRYCLMDQKRNARIRITWSHKLASNLAPY